MEIAKKETIERIRVYHNSEEEMVRTVKELKSQGYSDNLRVSMTGFRLVALTGLDNKDVNYLIKKFPNLTIHEDLSESYFARGKYIYCAEHEKLLEG